MAKDYRVTLGGADRRFKYTKAERRYLEGRFKEDIKTIIFERVAPMRDGAPTGGGILDYQIAFLWCGLKHESPKKITETLVDDWVESFMQTDGEDGKSRGVYELLNPAVKSALASGILGARIVFDEDEEGKAPEPVSTES